MVRGNYALVGIEMSFFSRKLEAHTPLHHIPDAGIGKLP
jgi:hypothetical protein